MNNLTQTKASGQVPGGTPTHCSNTHSGSPGKPRTRVPAAQRDPLDYDHPFESMRRFAQTLVLGFSCIRTRQAYYRQLRLLCEHFAGDPAEITEDLLRDYFLHVTRVKQWRPKTVRQAAACARIFFVDLLGHSDWTVFFQIRARDQERLPVVLTWCQVNVLLLHIRLRRYRIPLKLIYSCGLRVSECLNLTINDILGDEGKLIIRGGKGGRDRMVPISAVMVEDLRRYWRFHRHPRLIFPNVGRGSNDPKEVARRMHEATGPMPISSLQRLMVVARKELGLPPASVHTLRHSFATHLIERGVGIHTVRHLLGHKQIQTTMVYLHLTHRSEEDARRLMDELVRDLPR